MNLLHLLITSAIVADGKSVSSSSRRWLFGWAGPQTTTSTIDEWKILDDHAQSISGVLLYLRGAKSARRRVEELAEITLKFSGGETQQFLSIGAPAGTTRRRWQGNEEDLVVSGKKKKLRVLCLDGGGMRGLNLLVIIRELERRAGVPASELFDVVAGTSIGGCGALFLHHFGEGATDQAEIALEGLRTRCFAITSPGRLMFRGRRCHDDRAELLRELTGSKDLPLSCTNYKKPYAFVVACRKGPTTKEPEPFLFRTYDKATTRTAAESMKSTLQPLPGTCEATLIEAIAATTAAPTYFPPHEHNGEDLLADGGCCFNNPSMIALHEIAANFPDHEIDTLLSIGTGFVPSKSVQEQEEYLTHTFAKDILAANNPDALYERIDPPMPRRVSPGEHRPAVLDSMLAQTKQWLRDPVNSNRLDVLAARLLRNNNLSQKNRNDASSEHLIEIKDTQRRRITPLAPKTSVASITV